MQPPVGGHEVAEHRRSSFHVSPLAFSLSIWRGCTALVEAAPQAALLEVQVTAVRRAESLARAITMPGATRSPGFTNTFVGVADDHVPALPVVAQQHRVHAVRRPERVVAHHPRATGPRAACVPHGIAMSSPWWKPRFLRQRGSGE